MTDPRGEAPRLLTAEKIARLRSEWDECWTPGDEDFNALCDMALASLSATPAGGTAEEAEGTLLERIRWHQAQAAMLTQEFAGDPLIGVGNLPSPDERSK